VGDRVRAPPHSPRKFKEYFLLRTSIVLFYIMLFYVIKKVCECQNQQFRTMKQANKLSLVFEVHEIKRPPLV